MSIVYVVSAFPSEERSRGEATAERLRKEFPNACIVAVFLPGMLLQEDEVGAGPTIPRRGQVRRIIGPRRADLPGYATKSCAGMTAAMKTVLVTGAAQGLGLTVATLLSQREYRVILVDIQSVEAQVLRLRDSGGEAHGISGDVSSEAFVLELAQMIDQEYGALDGLVNNAGISLIVPAEQTSAAQWQRVMAINLFAPFLFCRYLGAQMLTRGSGSIVNVASIAGLAGSVIAAPTMHPNMASWV